MDIEKIFPDDVKEEVVVALEEGRQYLHKIPPTYRDAVNFYKTELYVALYVLHKCKILRQQEIVIRWNYGKVIDEVLNKLRGVDINVEMLYTFLGLFLNKNKKTIELYHRFYKNVPEEEVMKDPEKAWKDFLNRNNDMRSRKKSKKCIICQNGDLDFIKTKKLYSVYICESCLAEHDIDELLLAVKEALSKLKDYY